MIDLSAGPLTGIRVIDLTMVTMGPYATQMLGDMSADVDNVEPPHGNSTRSYRHARTSGISGSFLNADGNKRALAMDLCLPVARSALARQIEGADVFVHNLRPAMISRMRFGYDAVRAIRPNIVSCAATAFNWDGPYAERPAYDDLTQAGSGFAALATLTCGQPGDVPSVICDKLARQAINSAILARLLHRERGGGGQAVEVPILEAIAFNLVEHFGATVFDPPLGFARLRVRERRQYCTLDGYICLLPYSDRNRRDFFAFTSNEMVLADPCYATQGDRAQVFAEFYVLLADEAARRTIAAWMVFCEGTDFPCIPVIALDKIRQDQHVESVGLFRPAEYPLSKRYHRVRGPTRFGATPFRLRHHAPALGQRNREIFAEAGMSDAEIDVVFGSAA